MIRRKLAFAVAALVVVLALGLASLWQLLPEALFANQKFTSVASFLTALIASAITGYAGYMFSRFTERPIIRIEHVDLKSERMPFSLDENLWWYITHGSLMSGLPDGLKVALSRNEIQYYHLRSLSEVNSNVIKQYAATAAWTRGLLSALVS